MSPSLLVQCVRPVVVDGFGPEQLPCDLPADGPGAITSRREDQSRRLRRHCRWRAAWPASSQSVSIADLLPQHDIRRTSNRDSSGSIRPPASTDTQLREQCLMIAEDRGSMGNRRNTFRNIFESRIAECVHSSTCRAASSAARQHGSSPRRFCMARQLGNQCPGHPGTEVMGQALFPILAFTGLVLEAGQTLGGPARQHRAPDEAVGLDRRLVSLAASAVPDRR